MVEADAAGLWSNLWPAVLSAEKKQNTQIGLKTETADELCIYS